MTETPKVGLNFCENLNSKPILRKSLLPGVQGKRKKLGGRSVPPSVKCPKSARFYRVKLSSSGFACLSLC